ncbi:enoyl-CoA hydratase-related protein [Pseudonocardia ailaonensis]|uniref:Enoyl-CoA hydratase-related protein n=1 Tax=Pseudonocardia ailaonensis TaxID=367279 RepID=A0ABN2N3X7_9PSEU
MSVVAVRRPLPGVIELVLDRPDRLNALTREVVVELDARLTEVARDPACRVVVLTGAGRGFCAGLDLHGYGDEDEPGYTGSALQLFERQRDIAALAVSLHELRQPVIAAVNGPAAGGGLALALAADIRVCAAEAVFAVSFIRAGYSGCDIGVSWLLPRVIGAGPAHELMLTGRACDAREALRLGLVTDVVAADELRERAYRVAEEILRNPPFSVEMTKVGMWAALQTASLRDSVEFENRQQVLTALTDDAQEARAAFLQKRSPVYRRG